MTIDNGVHHIFVKLFSLGTILLCLLIPRLAWPHGFIGDRFLPTTIAIEDPFAQDELSFVLNHIREPGEGGEPSIIATEVEAEYAKRITPDFALSLGGAYAHLDPDGEPTRDGFGNLEIAGKWQLLTNVPHETVVSLGFAAEVGGTGDANAEANDFSTLSPALFFGKGFGNLPDSAWYLRPMALTCALSASFPTDTKTIRNGYLEQNPVKLNWGFSVLYDLHYLQTRVRDVGLRGIAGRLIPIVELSLDTCLNRGCSGKASGTVNPGVIYVGKHMQLGLEAQIPVNDRTGENVGLLFQVHFFLDDLFSHSLGKPLFGAS